MSAIRPAAAVGAVLEEDGSLYGCIFFHIGDDSGFTAVREAAKTVSEHPSSGELVVR